MKNRIVKLLALFFAASLIAAACGSDDGGSDSGAADLEAAQEALAEAEAAQAEAEAAAADAEQRAEDAQDASTGDEVGGLAGTTVTISGPERSESEAGALIEALNAFADANGMTIFYQGSANWEADINIQLAAGSNPDISVFPQPGKLADFARAGDVLPVPDDVVAAASEHWNDSAIGFGNVDGTQYGIPNKTDVKSLVWYQPARFEESGYEIPETLDELWDLSDQMIADGNTPWCIGIESGQATGWAFTDWTEDMMLRTTSAENYDRWTSGDLPFSSPEVTNAMQQILDQWNKPGFWFAEGGSIATTSFQANGQALVDGDCFMHRQASFWSSFLPEGTPIDGSEGSVGVFYFPEGDQGRTVLASGTLVGAFEDRPEVWAVIDYFGSPEYANARQVAQKELKGGGSVLSGFNTANLNADSSLWEPLEQSFLEIAASADTLRFDGSDLMPADVGAGTFWTEATKLVNGDTTVEAAAAAIDASWPG